MLDARISLGDALGGGPSVEVARPDGSTFRVKLAREGDVLKHGALRCVEGEGKCEGENVKVRFRAACR